MLKLYEPLAEAASAFPAAAFGDCSAGVEADVLAINRVGFIGGVEKVLLNGAASLSDRGWTTALACPAGDLAAEAEASGMPVHVADLGPMSLPDIGRTPDAWVRSIAGARRGNEAIFRCARLTRSRIIHVHHPAVAVRARQAARRLNAPMIWHVHETEPMTAAYRAVAVAAVQSCARLLCVSKASRDMVRKLGAPEARVRLIYNAAEPRFFAPPTIDHPEAWPPGPHVGLFGVLEPRKGHADLIRALAAACASWPTLQLWLVGGESYEKHAGYRAALERLAQALGVADQVHFTGRRTDIPQLMRRMDAVVCASVCSESLPTSLVEAAALGVPTIGTDVGGTSEIIHHCRTGLVVRPGAPGELARALDLVLSPAGKAFGLRARADARERFSPARFAADLEDSYRGLLSERPARVPWRGAEWGRLQ